MQRIRELAAYREILLNLVRKELKVKYTASVLGAVWSILNPIVFLAVFTFVVKVLGNATPHFPVFLLSGLLAWNLFSVAVGNGTRSVIDNGNLVKKVAFPREILPLAVVGVTLVDFVLQSMVLLTFVLASGYGFHAEALVLYPLSFVTLMVFT
ncbi:MAG: ABC transporter permease, partial [Actinomycetota bacterium]